MKKVIIGAVLGVLAFVGVANLALALNLTGTDNEHRFQIFQVGTLRISRDEAITAFAGGGQTSATNINAGMNILTTVATAADSVKLPVTTPTGGSVAAGGGLMVVVINSTATSANVYPQVGDYMNGTQNAAFAVAGGKTAIFFVGLDNKWWALLTA